ncbi:MAG: hypothetical protein ACLRM8_02240 [Alistipes sp.]
MAWRWNKAYTDPENWWTYYPELPFCGVEGDSVANRRAIYPKLVRDYRAAPRRSTTTSAAAPHARRRGLARECGRDLRLGSGLLPRRDTDSSTSGSCTRNRCACLRDPLPGEIPAGTRNGDIVTNVDFIAAGDYAGANPQRRRAAVSGNLAGEPQEWPRSMYYRYWTQHEIRPAHMGIATTVTS